VFQLRLSPRANLDLLEIWNYIADDSEANADGFIDKVYETIQMLGRQPGSGRRREELAPGIQTLRSAATLFSITSFIMRLKFVRVLHGARDVQNIFETSG
jgi:toxin ParE1/3/4